MRSEQALFPDIASLISRPQSAGKVFFVDSSHTNKSDSNEGSDPNHPLLTIAAAIAKCTANRRDYIFLMDAYTEDTEPIVINIDQLHLIGVQVNPLSPGVTLTPTGDNDIFQLPLDEADQVEIAGITFGGGTNKAGINFTGGNSAWIHNCYFGHRFAGGTPKYGIYNAAGFDPQYTLIEDCVFAGSANVASGLIATDGINISTSPGAATAYGVVIRRCLFNGIPGIAINIDGMRGGFILDCRFGLDANTAGAAITLGDDTRGCFVDGNRANWGDNAAMGALPWVDLATGDKNTWGYNIRGDAAQFPA